MHKMLYTDPADVTSPLIGFTLHHSFEKMVNIFSENVPVLHQIKLFLKKKIVHNG